MLLQWSHCEWPLNHQQKGSESTQIIIQTGPCYKIHKRFLNPRNFNNVYSSLCLVFIRLFEVFFSFLFFLGSSKRPHGISLEGMMLKLKLQYCGHLMRRVDSLEKTLMLGGIGGRKEGDDRGWDGWMTSLAQWTWVWVNSGSWWWTGRPGVLRFMGSQRVRHDWATELNWTELN